MNDRALSIAELLRDAGYYTYMSGKWHLATEMHVPNDAWPTRRGFERFFGTLTGCGSFYQPGTLTRGEADASAEADAPDFFYDWPPWVRPDDPGTITYDANGDSCYAVAQPKTFTATQGTLVVDLPARCGMTADAAPRD